MTDAQTDFANCRTAQWLNWIIAASLLCFALRVAVVQSREGGLPFQSANDRSRWCTIRALVDHGTFAIDDVIRDRRWDTIDKVAHPGRDGQLHFYSSKPTFLPTLVAIPYWILQRLTGWTLADQPLLVGRVLVGLVNGLLLLGLLIPLRQYLLRERFSAETAVYMMTFAAFGTYLTSFAVTLNNHLPAATGTMISAAAYLRLLQNGIGARSNHSAWMCGLAAAFAAINELPALAWTVLLGWGIWRQTSIHKLGWYAFAAIALFGLAAFTNWWAHESLLPAYAHRAAGADWTNGNWYVYPGSYWSGAQRSMIDEGESSVARYAFHVLMGHHGIFSLTPAWFILVAGMVRNVFRGQTEVETTQVPTEMLERTSTTTHVNALAVSRWTTWVHRPSFMQITFIVTIVTLVFYIFLRPQGDRNYGGRSVAFRWYLWLIPLWWLAMVTAVDRWLRRPIMHGLAWLLCGLSVASAVYGWLLPWKHPWLYEWSGWWNPPK